MVWFLCQLGAIGTVKLVSSLCTHSLGTLQTLWFVKSLWAKERRDSQTLKTRHRSNSVEYREAKVLAHKRTAKTG